MLVLVSTLDKLRTDEHLLTVSIYSHCAFGSWIQIFRAAGHLGIPSKKKEFL